MELRLKWAYSPLVVGTGLGLTIALSMGARFEPTIQPDVYVGPVNVGGLTPTEAQYQLRVWWETEKRQPLELEYQGQPVKLKPMTASGLHVTLDDASSVQKLPLNGIVASVEHFFHRSGQSKQLFDPVYALNGLSTVPLQKEMAAAMGPVQAAHIQYYDHHLVLTPEQPGFDLAVTALPGAVGAAIKGHSPVELPLSPRPKHVPDADLKTITDLVSAFGTHFPKSQEDRDHNIKTAAAKLNGVILMPGEKMSFNQTVGQRTAQAGFRAAPVYVNHQHAVGLGGGICQVSTTLYNASLLGNLAILEHQNHSLPVGYVPFGRDATVDWGEIDLIIENPYKTPIGITSEFEPGSLTFRIFGKPDPTVHVKIETDGYQSFPPEVQYSVNPKLQRGVIRVIDDGRRSHKIKTYRLVYRGGKLIEKQSLGESDYLGMPKILEIGPGTTPPPGAKLVQ